MLPQCPVCGGMMEIRRTFKGNPYGVYFYGCRNYPKCPGRVDMASEAGTYDSADDFSGGLFTVPRKVEAVPVVEGRQTKLFQTCALPQSWVELIHRHEIDRRVVRSACQWQMDFPVPAPGFVPTAVTRHTVSVAESILTRGTASFCSVELERELERTVSLQVSADDLSQALVDVASRSRWPSLSSRPNNSDAALLIKLLIDHLGENRCGWHLTLDIRLTSLLPLSVQSSDIHTGILLSHAKRRPIVVEITQNHGDSSLRPSQLRSELLRAGLRYHTIPSAEIQAGGGTELQRLMELLAAGEEPVCGKADLSEGIRVCKFSQQVQFAILEAVRGGWLIPGTNWTIGIQLPSTIWSSLQLRRTAFQAARDAAELIDRIQRLYSEDVNQTSVRVVFDSAQSDRVDIHIMTSAGGGINAAVPAFFVADALYPGDIAVFPSASEPLSAVAPTAEQAEWFLNLIFRKPRFREGQWEAVERALRGRDAVVLLPTGRGKSIAFQLAALLRAGRCIVVSPLVALIEDQIDNLGRVGIDRAVGITSQVGHRQRRQELEDALTTGHYLFSYIAPERLQIQGFRNTLRTLTTTLPVSLIAIDEAHCVSEWGHDFRTAYLNLGRVAREYCSSGDIVPPLMALSGTASKIVLKDVQRELGIVEFESIITPTSFDRANLKFSILRCSSNEKRDRIKGFLSKLPSQFGLSPSNFFVRAGEQTNAGLIFCPHVNGTYGVTEIANDVSSALGVQVDYYSGGAPKNRPPGNWNTVKHETMRRFKLDRVSVLACTKAFGMGIDKPNIRYTIHVGLPNSIESFYQEAGRAGRDGAIAECAVVVSNDYHQVNDRLLRPSTPLHSLISAARTTKWANSDDVTRALWFHANSFQGIDTEVNETSQVLLRLGDVSIPGVIAIRSAALGSERIEKVLHRLVVLGVVSDYTLEYGSAGHSTRIFQVRLSGAEPDDVVESFRRYVASYQPRLGEEEASRAKALIAASHNEFVLQAANLLIEFIYEHVEQARRRSLSEMLRALDQSTSGEELRTRILDYLQHTEFDEKLDVVRTSTLGGLDALEPLLDELVTPNDAAALRGSVGRLLGSYPDVPGLLLIRALTESIAKDCEMEVVRENIQATIEFAADKYGIPTSAVGSACGMAIARMTGSLERAVDMVSVCAASPHADRRFLRGLLSALPSHISDPAKHRLFTLALERTEHAVKAGS